MKDYVKIYTDDNDKPLLTRTNLKGMGDQLPAKQFIRVHKSYIVNLNKVSSISTDAVLISKLEIPLGESYKAELKSSFK